MATLSDGVYSTYSQQVRGNPQQNRGGTGVITPFFNQELLPSPSGIEEKSVWSSWSKKAGQIYHLFSTFLKKKNPETGGSDRVPANYPCALNEMANCGMTGPDCGKSLILRENSVWPQVVSTADGTGYQTTTFLPPNQPFTTLGFGIVSRKAIKDFNPNKLTCGPGIGCGCKNDAGCKKCKVTPRESETIHPPYSVSQLFLNSEPLLHYWTGRPFFFKTDQTVFMYMIPNGLIAKTGSGSYRVSVLSASQEQESCVNCTGY